LRVPKGSHENQLIDGAILRTIIGEGLNVIGTDGLHVLFYHLEQHGISLEAGKAYSLKSVREILTDLFGNESSDMMMERIYKSLRGRSRHD
jgi:hypothetical protein